MGRTRVIVKPAIVRLWAGLMSALIGIGVLMAGPVGAAVASGDLAPYHKKLAGVYDLVAATPFNYSQDEVDRYGEDAMSLSGDGRLYALWRVLYAYKTNQNAAKMHMWHDRIVQLAHKENDSNLDMLARFMLQAFENEANAYAGLTEREWMTYLTVPDRALQNIVTLERERQLQYSAKWAEAIDLGDTLVVRLQAEGEQAYGILIAAHQTLAYNMTRVGDYDAYADHMLAVAQLSRTSAFFPQKMDMLYDLTFFAAQDNDTVLAERLQKLYAAQVSKYDIADLKVWDEELCATVEDKAENYAAVISCLRDSAAYKGSVTGAHDAFKLRLLTKAYARLYDVGNARFYLAKLRDIPTTIYPRDKVFDTYVEAYLKAGEGRHAEAFSGLGDWALASGRTAEKRRVAAVQDMYKALRNELDRKTAEGRLLNKQVELGHWLFGAAAVIVILLSLMIAGGAVWVIRMRRMQWRLKDAHEHAEAANAAKSRFLAVMSHELRTPLNGVLGMAQALRKEELTETQRGQVDILVESGETLMVLLNDVLDMSRIEAGKVELAPTPASMRDMIERVINTYAPMIEDKALAMRYDFDDNVGQMMSFDVLRVYQCLSNLVSNAIKFTDHGSVRILTSATPLEDKPGHLVRIEVRDTGIGMSKTTLDKLFDAYAQADAGTARKYGGSGLGLSISRRLTELMGGSLSVTSEEGIGSSFVMTFQAGEVVQAAPKTALVEAPAPAQVVQGHKILLVDDHPVNRKVVRLFLEPFGYDITEAVDGQEALDLNMSDYDLILMDLNMPRMGGLEATRLFRASEAANRHVPIVALTADAMQDQIEACIAAGMDAHISKPILMDTLIDTVSTLLSRGSEVHDAAVA